MTNSGGIDWTKAGNGIVQDEIINVDSKQEIAKAYEDFYEGKY